MRTKTKRAGLLDTRDELVKQGGSGPHYTVALCEVLTNGRTVTVRHATTIRTRAEGGSASQHARSSTSVETYDVRDRVRVLS